MNNKKVVVVKMTVKCINSDGSEHEINTYVPEIISIAVGDYLFNWRKKCRGTFEEFSEYNKEQEKFIKEQKEKIIK